MSISGRTNRGRSYIQLGILSIIFAVIVLVILSPMLNVLFGSTVGQQPPQVHGQGTVTTSPSAIYQENQQPGTTAWEIDTGADLLFIQGYADHVSALPGESVHIYVSSILPSTYQLNVYRIGWYGGKGGRLYLTQTNLQSPAQGTWSTLTGLVGCTTCTLDPATNLVELHWRSSDTITIGPHWLSGVYLLKVTAANGAETYIPLVVRSAHSDAAALVNISVNTYQAYNLWGDYSLYKHNDKGVLPGKATKVTFNRPYDRGAGSGDFLSWDIQSVRWLERSGLDMTYTTDVDVAEQPQELLHHRLYLDLGHDEYWTKAMRDGVVAARDKGVSLAFLGANDAYWQARLEPDTDQHADRILVCYKVSSSATDPASQLSADPDYPQYPDLVTAEWSDPLLHHSAEELIGLHYGGSFDADNYYPDWMVVISTDPLLKNTGLTTGSTVRGGLLGYEYDSCNKSTDTPASLTILAKSLVVNRYGISSPACTAYYRAASGAFVFDAGTIWWSWGLDTIAPLGASRTNVLKGSPAISALTANIIQAMLAATPAAPVPLSA